MKHGLAVLFAAAAALLGQTGTTLPLSVPTPPGVTGGLGAVIGGLGSTPYYYWIVARYPGGNSAPSGPIAVLNGPATLTGGNFIRLTWDAALGATAYDVLRTSTPSAPVGPCGCLEAGAVAGTSVTDTGSALGAYTVTTRRASEGSLYLDNLIAAPPALQLVVDGVAVTLNGGAPSGGAVGGASSVAAGQVLFGTGAGVAGSEAAFSYNATDNRLTVGSPTGFLKMGEVGVFGAVWGSQASPSVSNYALLANGTETYLNSPQNLRLRIANADAMAIFPSTRNVGINTTTDDGVNKLQVAGNIIVNAGNALRLQNAAANQFASMALNASSVVTLNYPLTVGPSSALTSAVTLGVHDGTPTTGVTQFVVRAGAANTISTKILDLQNNAGNSRGYFNVDANGARLVLTDPSGSPYISHQGSSSDFGLGALIRFLPGDINSTADLVLSRSSANVLRISNTGTTGGGLLIEGLKSTTGEVFVCVDTTGRFVRSATACVGTI